MINKVELKNFKCYTHQTFDLGMLTIFCGNNSVGKSTAIQALAIPFQSFFESKVSISGKLVELGNLNDIYSAYASDEELKISLTFDNNNFVWGELDVIEKKNQDYLSIIGPIVFKKIKNKYFKNNKFQFLEAERYGPRMYLKNNYDSSIDFWIGVKGEYTYQILNQITNTRLNLDKNDKRILNPDEGLSVRRNIINWMSEISPGFNFDSDDVKEAGISHAQFQAYGSQKNKPINMGFGLSYAISIVTALLVTKPGGLVIIENPEAHLHPRGQSYLGRLIARAALSGVQVIIETHSDHLLNGVRVVARLEDDYEKGKFKVFYVAGGQASPSKVTEIDIGDKGELSEWPQGFFDQQAYDVKTLIKGVELKKVEQNHE